MKRFGGNERKNTIATALLTGLAVSLLIAVVGSVITTSMVSGGQWEESVYQKAACAIWLIASFLGSGVAALIWKDRAWLTVLIHSGAFLFALVVVSILVFDSDLASIWLGGLCILGGSILAFFIFGKKKGRKMNFKKYRIS